MPEQPIHDPRLVEAMEACRPASDDMNDPALAPLASRVAADPRFRDRFERLQQLDVTLAGAFRDVPVPDGLADRITTRLAAARTAEIPLAEHQAGAETAATEPIAEAAKPRRRLLRRWLVAGVAGAAVAASLLVAFMLPEQQPQVLQPEVVWEGAKDFFETERDAGGQLVAESPPPAEYPTSSDFSVARFPHVRWRPIRDFLGRQGVAYEIGRPGGPRATLYVVQCSVANLPAAPPLSPARTTGNRSVGAWQTGELLYVLVVEGGARTYESYLPRRTWT